MKSKVKCEYRQYDFFCLKTLKKLVKKVYNGNGNFHAKIVKK